jgi:hypothetical protein
MKEMKKWKKGMKMYIHALPSPMMGYSEVLYKLISLQSCWHVKLNVIIELYSIHKQKLIQRLSVSFIIGILVIQGDRAESGC